GWKGPITPGPDSPTNPTPDPKTPPEPKAPATTTPTAATTPTEQPETTQPTDIDRVLAEIEALEEVLASRAGGTFETTATAPEGTTGGVVIEAADPATGEPSTQDPEPARGGGTVLLRVGLLLAITATAG